MIWKGFWRRLGGVSPDHPDMKRASCLSLLYQGGKFYVSWGSHGILELRSSGSLTTIILGKGTYHCLFCGSDGDLGIATNPYRE